LIPEAIGWQLFKDAVKDIHGVMGLCLANIDMSSRIQICEPYDGYAPFEFIGFGIMLGKYRYEFMGFLGFKDLYNEFTGFGAMVD
jgi:hypothetical protein